MPVEADRSPRPGDREPRVALEPGAEPADQELERGGAVGVADEPVREGECRTVERAGCRDAEVREAGSAEVLDERRPAGMLDVQAGHPAPTASKRTRRPGASTAGSSEPGSHMRAVVLPMRRQPPGLDRG